MAALKLGSGLGLFLAVVLVVFIGLQFFRMPSYSSSSWSAGSSGSARLPCLANKQCPGGLTCSGGFCSEGFQGPVAVPSIDMSSCGAKECKGINAPCSRRAEPCPEGTFCQNDNCVSIAAPSQGEAYNQIGTLLN